MSDEVTITSIGGAPPATVTNFKRDQLAAEIMRFADRYAGRMTLEAEQLRSRATTAELRRFATGWALASQDAALVISIGPNSVENLLDMLVFATLTRIEVESYWVPQYLTGTMGDGLLRSARALENDIWELAERVLTAEQQATLRGMIQDWNDANPDQHYFWYIRFSGLSGQRARDLAQVEQTGGLLAEIQLTREASREMQAGVERLLRYLQHAPASIRLNAEFAMRDALLTPEIVKMLDDAHRLAQSSGRYADIAEGMPAESQRLIDVLFERTASEREAAIVQLQEVLSQELAAAIDQAAERQHKVVTALLTSNEFHGTVDQLGEAEREIVGITFARGILLILIWAGMYVLARITCEYLRRRLFGSTTQETR